MLVLLMTAATGSWAQEPVTTYTVTMDDGKVDADKWTVDPTTATTDGAAEGTKVTLTYSGRRKVKSITAATAPTGPEAIPLTLEALTDGTIVVSTPKDGMQYAKNGGAKTAITADAISVVKGDKIAFYGKGTDISSYYAYDGSTYTETFTSIAGGTAEVKAYGNIMSLVDETDFATNTKLTAENAFTYLFTNNTKLKDVSGLLLPATTLTKGCYERLFSDCASLTTAPELPAETLAAGCYQFMFMGCTSLTAAPELPATTLAENCYSGMFASCASLTTAPELKAETLAAKCYQYMFSGCTSLASAPKLPATELQPGCYYGMFSGCTSLTTAPELKAEKLADYCYWIMFDGCTSLTTAPALPATTLTTQCYYGMFQGCTSLTTAPELKAETLADNCYNSMFKKCTSLTTAPELPATTLAEACYRSMFSGCTSLTTTPVLPATTLVKECYQEMFNGCTSLNSVTCLATDISAFNCVTNWLKEVAATGTFIKPASMTIWTVDSPNGIPTGWTTKNYVDPMLLATPLTMEAITAGTIIVSKPRSGMQYSLNGGAKTAVPDGTAIDVAVGDKVAFYGDGTNITSYYTANTNFTKISGGTAEVKVYGNIMSLVDETGFATNTTLPDTHTFYGLFSGTSSSDNNTNLKDASGLLLPATELQSYCYSSMFSYCTALTAAPKLPATALAQYCYNSMFRDCTNLTTAPELPATTLAEYCYMNMFNGCKALTTAPELKATTLVNSCYWQMFRNCKNLNSVTCLATDISAADCTYYWLYSVSATGTFTKASSMTSWTADSHSGIPSGWTPQDYSE